MSAGNIEQAAPAAADECVARALADADAETDADAVASVGPAEVSKAAGDVGAAGSVEPVPAPLLQEVSTHTMATVLAATPL